MRVCFQEPNARSVRVGTVVLAAVVAAGACASTDLRRSRSSPVQSYIKEQIEEHKGLPWSSERRLAWTDFQGIAPARGDAGAQTAYSLFHGARCSGRTFDFSVIAAFLPRQSWVRPAILTSPAESSRTLRHEQTHFDLSEVHARRMRRYIGGLFEPCMKSAEELKALADKYVRDEAAAQRRYDEETSHGRVARKQTEWETEVGRQLAALSKFAGSEVPGFRGSGVRVSQVPTFRTSEVHLPIRQANSGTSEPRNSGTCSCYLKNSTTASIICFPASIS